MRRHTHRTKESSAGTFLATPVAVRWLRALSFSAAIAWAVAPAGCDFPSCRSDLDCPAHQACNWLAACVPGCRSDECPKGMICKAPQSLPPFAFGSPDEYTCQRGCSKSTDCEAGFLCDAEG